MKQDYDLEFQVEAEIEKSANEFFQIVSIVHFLSCCDDKERLQQKYGRFMELREAGMPDRYELERLQREAILPSKEHLSEEAYQRILRSVLQKLPDQLPKNEVNAYGQKLSLEGLLQIGKEYVAEVAVYAARGIPTKIKPEKLLRACWTYHQQQHDLNRLQNLLLDYFKDQLQDFNSSQKGIRYDGQGLYILLDFYDFLEKEKDTKQN